MSETPSPTTKVVSIADAPETIIIEDSRPTTALPRRASSSSHKPLARRRVPPSPALAPTAAVRDAIPKVALDQSPAEGTEDCLMTTGEHTLPGSNFVAQIREWLHQERKRRHERRERRKEKRDQRHQKEEDESGESADESLDALEALLGGSSVAVTPVEKHHHQHQNQNQTQNQQQQRRKNIQRKRSLIGISAASDTEYASDGEAIVPTCEERLETVEELGMEKFKEEVLKLTHTLKCKGWRRVPLDRWSEIGVKRISGALTNAVYMVSPPKKVPPPTSSASDASLVKSGRVSKYPTPLLLRIYGPQVSHLIDRDTELSILRRLARQKIGPRLLGTFLNGRFEEFFPSSTLTKDDIRRPEVSRHIAKRLKELHEGIEVLPSERDAGPIVWKNWEKWETRASKVIARYESHRSGSANQLLGSSWSAFASAVQNYRSWLTARCGGEEGVRRQLVFAHNDTQYGNILRLQTATNSPLLLPSNEHRQLIVIDFEYASPNTAAWEFANHFCEWMSDYHDPANPHIIHVKRYPTIKEQRNFLRAYVEHSLRSGRASNPPSNRNSGVFDLDGGKTGRAVEEEERKREEKILAEVERLREETRVWRVAVHAMWTVWGIVQAKDELADRNDEASSGSNTDGDAEDRVDNEEEEEEEEEFDYFGYAREKAGLFWSDLEALGVLREVGGVEEPPRWAKKIVEV